MKVPDFLKDKRVVVGLAVGVPVITLVCLYFFVFSAGASDLRVTNVTASSFTVTWMSSKPSSGQVIIKETKSFLPGPLGKLGAKVYYDDRDQNYAEIQAAAARSLLADSAGTPELMSTDVDVDVVVEQKGKYYAHHVTVSGLDSEKEYYFRVGNGLAWYGDSALKGVAEDDPYTALSDNKLAVKTFVETEEFFTPDPSYGFIAEDDNFYPGTDVLVYSYVIDNDGKVTLPLSGITVDEYGTWGMDLTTARYEDGTRLANYDDSSEQKLSTVFRWNGEIYNGEASITTGTNAPSDTLVLDTIVEDQGNTALDKVLSLIPLSKVYAREKNNRERKLISKKSSPAQVVSKTKPSKRSNTDPSRSSGSTSSSSGSKLKPAIVVPEAPVLPSKRSESASSPKTPVKSVSGAKSDGSVPVPATPTNPSPAQETPPHEDSPVISRGRELHHTIVSPVGTVEASVSDKYEVNVNESAVEIDTNGSGHVAFNLGPVAVEGHVQGVVSTNVDLEEAGRIAGDVAEVALAVPIAAAVGTSEYVIKPMVDYTGKVITANGVVLGTKAADACMKYADVTSDAADVAYSLAEKEDAMKTAIDSVAEVILMDRIPEADLGSSSDAETSNKFASLATEKFDDASRALENARNFSDILDNVSTVDGKICIDIGDNEYGKTIVEELGAAGSAFAKGVALKGLQGLALTTSGIRKTGEDVVNWGVGVENLGIDIANGFGASVLNLVGDGVIPWVAKQATVAGDTLSGSSERFVSIAKVIMQGVNKLTGNSGSMVSRLYAADKVIETTKDGIVIFAGVGEFSIIPDGYQVTTTNKIDLGQGDAAIVVMYLDENENGVLDEGEKYLENAGVEVGISKEEQGFNYSVEAGFNFVSFPFIANDVQKASDLIATLSSDGCDATLVARYDGGWQSYDVRSAAQQTADFALVPGEGYVIRSHNSCTLSISGRKVTDPVQVDIKQSWNLIGIHGLESYDGYTADDMIASMKEQGIPADIVTQWTRGRYESRITGEVEGQEKKFGFDFPIEEYKAYFVRSTGEGRWDPGEE